MKKILKILFFAGALLTWAVLITWLVMGERFERKVNETRSELVGNAAHRYIAKQQTGKQAPSDVKTVAGLHDIEIALSQPTAEIYRVSGVANSYLVKTSEGNVLFDTGLALQSAKHKRLLQKAASGKITHIILSHSHADHIGATNFWKAEFPAAKVVTHRRFIDGQRYLKDLQDHFWNRNRLLYTFMPETPPEDGSMFAYGAVTPDILIEDNSEYRFTQGGVEFVVLPTPGAEGEDNIVLWLPQSKALLSGDFFGPLFPMMPNLFTLRGEKFRDPVAYTQSLKQIIKLNPEWIMPSHFEPIEGKEQILSDLMLMHDATDYVHQATIDGMNQGKSIWQLMREIELPESLEVSQGHGKVSWNVRSIWEYYSTWFHFESTTELYPVPVNTLYPEIADLIEPQAILKLAKTKLANKEYEQTLHLVEIVLSSSPSQAEALQLRLQALERMLERAWLNGSNYSETGWLASRIKSTKEQLNATTE